MNLNEIGWEAYAPKRAPNPTYGRVAQATRDHLLIWTEDGEIEARISGRLRYSITDLPCVGDWVILREGNVVAEILPRRTKLSRKQPGRETREQVLAANLDVLFIVIGLDSDYNQRRLERYLVLAYESGARPVIVLNKADLREDIAEVVHRTKKHAPGVPVIALSALRNWGLDAIPEHLRTAETAAFIGSSGAGKSTIVNRLSGGQRQRTAEVREADNKGRHTTTCRELILTAERWLLMDLPGLRELQLWADPERVDQTFSEIADLAANCRFRDCSHGTEPGCAVREAGLDPSRIGNYQKLKREIAFLERQTDLNLARETKKRWKAVEREFRRHPKRF